MTPGRRRAAASGSGKLAPYQRKRDFARTPEPRGMSEPHGGRKEGGVPRFVVQLHRARRLHYDVRFEIGGCW
jgi:bifunctional non-homologous end joining protein LigD